MAISKQHAAAIKQYGHFKAGETHVLESRERLREQIGERKWPDTKQPLSEEEWTLLLDTIKGEHEQHLDLLRSVNLA